MVCHVTGYQPGKFIHTIGDAHVYKNHVEAIKKQLTRTPKPFPILKLNRDVKDIEDFRFIDSVVFCDITKNKFCISNK